VSSHRTAVAAFEMLALERRNLLLYLQLLPREIVRAGAASVALRQLRRRRTAFELCEVLRQTVC
jgi:hypothetical protein